MGFNSGFKGLISALDKSEQSSSGFDDIHTH